MTLQIKSDHQKKRKIKLKEDRRPLQKVVWNNGGEQEAQLGLTFEHDLGPIPLSL